MNLYSTYAKNFSATRQAPWKGWEVLPYNKLLDNNKNVLDLGCGNGRFLKYLLNKRKESINFYLGVDNSQELLNIAKQELNTSNTSKFIFENVDLLSERWNLEIKKEFNLIVAFGLMHHLYTYEQRKNLLKNSIKLLSKGGFLIITYWQFALIKRFEDLIINPSTLSEKFELKENDYILKFGNDKGAYRFCHFTDIAEIVELEKDIPFKMIKTFYSDGKDNQQNLYKIYQKI